MSELLQNILNRLVGFFGSEIGRQFCVALLVLAGVLYAVRLVRRRKTVEQAPPPPESIEVRQLSQEGPPETPPILEFFNLPVRVAAVVLAPAGRVRAVPPDDQVGPLLDTVVPGLADVVAHHRPIIRRWPQQLSPRGFGHALFAHLRLPGEGGKGTVWSAAAGMIRLHGQPIMVGLVLRAAAPNSFGQYMLDSDDKWLGCFRVRLK